jgi:hypothetical protein
MTLGREISGRQRPRTVGELGRSSDCTARSRAIGRGREGRGHLLVRAFGRERKVACPFLRIDDNPRQAAVSSPPRSRRPRGEVNRCKQRMREPDPIVEQLDQPRASRGFEVSLGTILNTNRNVDHRDGRARQRRRKKQRLGRWAREERNPPPHELTQVRRNRKWFVRWEFDALTLERSGELKREKRVAFGRLVNAQECGTRQ